MDTIIYKNMSEEKYIKWLINGQKSVEVRLNKPEYLNAKYIIFTCLDTKNVFKFKIINKTIFNSFKECVEFYGFNKLICDSNSNNDCINKYKSFYLNKEYLNNKVIALKLDLIS